MKVRTCKSVDLDLDVDVEIEDLLTEFSARIEEDTSERARWVISTLDWMTRILAHVTDEAIGKIPEGARQTICERLMDQASRYDSAPITTNH